MLKLIKTGLLLSVMLAFISGTGAVFAGDAAGGGAGDSSPVGLQPAAGGSASGADSAEVSSTAPTPSAPAPNSQTSPQAPAPGTGSPTSAGEVKKNIEKITSMSRDIFLLEKLAETKNDGAERERIEQTLNNLYSAREALSAKLASDCASDTTHKSLRELRAKVFNLKLFEAAGFDSTVSRLLADGSLDSQSTVSVSMNAKESAQELKSFIKLEESRLQVPVSYEEEVDKNLSSYDPAKMGELTAEAALAGAAPEDGGTIEKNAPLSAAELTPEAGAEDASIDKPVKIAFDAEKIRKSGKKLDVKIKRADIVQKFAPKAAPGSVGKIDVRWDPAENSLVVTHSSPLERQAIYGVNVEFSHGIESAPPATAETQVAQAPPAGSSEVQTAPAPAAQQPSGAAAAYAGPKFARSLSVSGGMTKKVDVNLADNVVDYTFNWNFGTKSYPAPPAPADGGASQTAETGLGGGEGGSGEVSVTDRRDTDEGSLRQAGGSTGENSVKKELPASPGFESPMAVPTIVLRNPEGPAVRRNTEIFVVFSCDIDPSSIKPGTMTLSIERGRGLFEPVTGEAFLSARKLTFTPFEQLVPGKNYSVRIASVRSATGVNMPVDETYFFRTAPAVIATRLPHDGSVSLAETFEITLSQNIDDVKIRFNLCDGTRESELDFELCERLYKNPAAPSGISKLALSTGGPSIAPFAARTPQGQPVAADVTGRSRSNVKDPAADPGDVPVVIQFRPKKPLEKGKFYKLDVYSGTEYIDDGIIRFKAR